MKSKHVTHRIALKGYPLRRIRALCGTPCAHLFTLDSAQVDCLRCQNTERKVSRGK